MDRRQFIRFVPLVALASSAFAQQDEVDPKSPTAIALGYSTDHSRVDTTRWSKKGQDVQGQQRCQTCALFTSIDNGTSTDNGNGVCSIFAGRQVTGNGWCNAWTRR